MISFGLALLATVVYIVWKWHSSLSTLASFCWSCFLQPIGHSSGSQQVALENFYARQASVYDATRTRLLQGREQMLRLAKAHFHTLKGEKLVWVDLGGGTGWNIEYMNSIYSLKEHFSAIHLVDLSPSLCEVAKNRIQNLGLDKIVFVHCCDVNEFQLPVHETAHFVSLSYSLSMIPNYYAAVDKVCKLLDPNFGIAGVVDFYVQSQANYSTPARISTLGGELWRHVNWFSRTFWRLWFEFDRVHLDPARRDYLEYRLGTIKSLNQRNAGLGYIPYYVWVGCDKRRAQDIEYRHQLAIESPFLAPKSGDKDSFDEKSIVVPASKGLEVSRVCAQQNLPYPSFYYQREIWRIFYAPRPTDKKEFSNQYIYAFTWEDPRADQEILKLRSSDVVLAITSAGDNLLAYASLENPPRRIHGVDMNPCQGHLVELKLAALRACTYEEFWSMFGTGKIDNFRQLLTDKLSVHMSSQAMQWWYEKGPGIFKSGLYDHSGSTRWALRLARLVFSLAGVKKDVEKLCYECETIEEQVKVWKTRIRPALLESRWVRAVLCSPVFLWKALGVPVNQADQIETSLYDYIVNTLDPIIEKSLVSNDNYFYYLCLQGHYSQDNCPDYLTQRGYSNLIGQTARRGSNSRNQTAPIDGIRIHTDSISDVVDRLSPNSVTVAVIMDHLDWFGPQDDIKPVEEEVVQLRKALAPGGRVLLRSSSTKPWYLEVFKANGFNCSPAAVRNPGTAIDRVNMYASTWLCVKTAKLPAGMNELKI